MPAPVARWAGVALGLLLACKPRADDACAVAARGTDHPNTAAICERQLAAGDSSAGLAAMKARAAMKDLAGARALLQRLRDTEAEAPALVALTELELAVDPARAAAAAARATDRLVALGDHARASHTARLQTRPAWAAARYQEALSALARAVAEAQQAGDTLATIKAQLGQFLILYELGDLRNAERTLSRAEAHAAEVDRDTQALLALNRGLLADADGHAVTARAAFERALKLSSDQPKSEIAWSAHVNLIAIALSAGQVAAAEQTRTTAQARYEGAGFRARATSRVAWGFYSGQLDRLRGRPAEALGWLDRLTADAPNADWRWKIALERGRALLALGRRAEASAAFEQSIAGVESLRREQPDAHKSWALAGRRAPFVALFELHARAGDAGRALEIAERTLGRTFLEAFAANTAALAGPSDSYSDTARRAEALKQLMPALDASPLAADTTLSWNGLRQRLADDDHALIFFEGEDRLHVSVVARRQVRLLTPAPSLGELRPLVSRLLQRPDDSDAAARLGSALFPPGALPAAGGRVHLAAPALLGRLPWAALRVDGRPLVEGFELAQVPSLHGLLALRRPAAATEASATVLANASGDLPAAEHEALALAARLGPATRVFLGREATRARLRAGSGSSLLHLALHSGVGATGPWLGLADGRVLASELVRWRMRANLVVLSSCASAATPDPGLWGSLAASFLASGTPAVLASLWSTKDEVNRRFLDRFYAEGGARDPVAALALTQRRWLDEGRPVAEWGAYAVYGGGREHPPQPALSQRGGAGGRAPVDKGDSR